MLKPIIAVGALTIVPGWRRPCRPGSIHLTPETTLIRRENPALTSTSPRYGDDDMPRSNATRRSIAVIAAAIATLSGASSVQAQTAPDYAAISREIGVWNDNSLASAAMARTHASAFDRDIQPYTNLERQRVFRRANTLLSASRTNCEVTNAARLGRTERQRDIVEVACANGYGYILVDGSAPAAFDCLQIAQATVVVQRERSRRGVGVQCMLDENGG